MKNKHPEAVAFGKLGGSTITKAKSAAARINGKKGGRPRNAKQPRQRRKGAK